MKRIPVIYLILTIFLLGTPIASNPNVHCNRNYCIAATLVTGAAVSFLTIESLLVYYGVTTGAIVYDTCRQMQTACTTCTQRVGQVEVAIERAEPYLEELANAYYWLCHKLGGCANVTQEAVERLVAEHQGAN